MTPEPLAFQLRPALFEDPPQGVDALDAFADDERAHSCLVGAQQLERPGEDRDEVHVGDHRRSGLRRDRSPATVRRPVDLGCPEAFEGLPDAIDRLVSLLSSEEKQCCQLGSQGLHREDDERRSLNPFGQCPGACQVRTASRQKDEALQTVGEPTDRLFDSRLPVLGQQAHCAHAMREGDDARCTREHEDWYRRRLVEQCRRGSTGEVVDNDREEAAEALERREYCFGLFRMEMDAQEMTVADEFDRVAELAEHRLNGVVVSGVAFEQGIEARAVTVRGDGDRGSTLQTERRCSLRSPCRPGVQDERQPLGARVDDAALAEDREVLGGPPGRFVRGRAHATEQLGQRRSGPDSALSFLGRGAQHGDHRTFDRVQECTAGQGVGAGEYLGEALCVEHRALGERFGERPEDLAQQHAGVSVRGAERCIGSSAGDRAEAMSTRRACRAQGCLRGEEEVRTGVAIGDRKDVERIQVGSLLSQRRDGCLERCEESVLLPRCIEVLDEPLVATLLACWHRSVLGHPSSFRAHTECTGTPSMYPDVCSILRYCRARRSQGVVELVTLLLAGYLLGSLPTAQIAAYALAGIDLRERAPTVSGSGVYYAVARWAVVPVGLVDVAKGAIATYVPYLFGGSEGLAVACGLAAVIGHNWPVWLGFRGGRGLSPFLGMLAVVFPLGALLLLLGALGLGRLLHRTPVGALLGLTALPGVVIVTGGSDALVRGTVGMLVLTIVKRLEANRRPLPRDPVRRRIVLWRRFWYDRDEERWPPTSEPEE